MPCEEDIGYEPPPLLRCPCKGCEGFLSYYGLNGHSTLIFLDCQECGHTCVVPIKGEEDRLGDLYRIAAMSTKEK